MTPNAHRHHLLPEWVDDRPEELRRIAAERRLARLLRSRRDGG